MCGCEPKLQYVCAYHKAEIELGLPRTPHEATGPNPLIGLIENIGALRIIVANYDQERFDRMLRMHNDAEG